MTHDGLMVIGWSPDTAQEPLALGQVVPKWQIHGPDRRWHVVSFRVVREATFDEWRQCVSEELRGQYGRIEDIPYREPKFYAVQMD